MKPSRVLLLLLLFISHLSHFFFSLALVHFISALLFFPLMLLILCVCVSAGVSQMVLFFLTPPPAIRSDHEVHQSAGAGSADRHWGESTLHLRDCAREGGLHRQRQGAEQRRVPGPRSVSLFLLLSWPSNRPLSSCVFPLCSRRNGRQEADRQHPGVHWRDQFSERSGRCRQVQTFKKKKKLT